LLGAGTLDGDDVTQVPAARQAVDARHGHHVAGRKALEHFEKLAPVAARARYLLAVNLRASRAAKLLKLGVERLPVGANSGIAERAILLVRSGHIFAAISVAMALEWIKR
jgi:hypothetical protein